MSNFALVGATAGIVIGQIIGWFVAVAAGTSNDSNTMLGVALFGLAVLAAVTWSAFYVGTLL